MIYTESTISISVPKVKAFMRTELNISFDRYDPYNSGEVNSTFLAENAAQEFNYFEGEDIPEVLFEIAYEIAEEYEA
jgi:hypothetical protein